MINTTANESNENVEEVIESIKNRISRAEKIADEAYSTAQYDRAKGAQYELEELLSEIEN